MLGEPDSLVFGSIIDGVFEGKIITDRDAYYVENAKHYFPNRTHLDHGFHSVIYNENNVDDPYAHRRDGKSNEFIYFLNEITTHGTLTANKTKKKRSNIHFISLMLPNFISRYLNKSIRDSIQDHSETSIINSYIVSRSWCLVAISIYLMGDDYFFCFCIFPTDYYVSTKRFKFRTKSS